MDTQILVSMRGVSEQAFGSRCADGLYQDFVTHPAATQATSEEVYGRDFADHPIVMAISGSVSSSFSFSPTNSTCVKQLLLDINQEVTRA